MKIPIFRAYRASEDWMNRRQLSFYKMLEQKLCKGEFVDVEGNISYIFTFLRKVLVNWKSKDFDELSEFLIRLSELYTDEVEVKDACLRWAYDCLLGLGKYEEFLEKTEQKNVFGTLTHFSNLRINIQKKLGLDAAPVDVLLMFGGRKTKFIANNQALYRDKITTIFSDFSEENKGWFNIFERSTKAREFYDHGLFQGAPVFPVVDLGFKITAYYTNLRSSIIDELSTNAENLARVELGVPRVGEGWVSETLLFRKLEAEFSMTKVVHHGRPGWLGRQHFDIWLPNWKIAVEYHGQQHFEPVDFFGGLDAYELCVERDARKAALAEANGVKLFVIDCNDDQDLLIKEIYKIADKRKYLLPLV